MKIYKVYLDLSLVITVIIKFKIQEYNSPFPIVFVEAGDPDEACFLATSGLMKTILNQDSSIETRILCREIRHDIRVLRAVCQ